MVVVVAAELVVIVVVVVVVVVVTVVVVVVVVAVAVVVVAAALWSTLSMRSFFRSKDRKVSVHAHAHHTYRHIYQNKGFTACSSKMCCAAATTTTATTTTTTTTTSTTTTSHAPPTNDLSLKLSANREQYGGKRRPIKHEGGAATATAVCAVCYSLLLRLPAPNTTATHPLALLRLLLCLLPFLL